MKAETSTQRSRVLWWFSEIIYAPAAAPVFVVILILAASASVCAAPESNVRHNLEVELFPAKHMLQVVDRMEIEKCGDDHLDFTITSRAQEIEVTVNHTVRRFNFRDGQLKVDLTAGERNQKIQVSIRFVAIFDDPVPIRPLNSDNPGYGVTATISERGSFLLAGSDWYPKSVRNDFSEMPTSSGRISLNGPTLFR